LQDGRYIASAFNLTQQIAYRFGQDELFDGGGRRRKSSPT
jgi:hypothetical protein